jgi:amino acid permease
MTYLGSGIKALCESLGVAIFSLTGHHGMIAVQRE